VIKATKEAKSSTTTTSSQSIKCPKSIQGIWRGSASDNAGSVSLSIHILDGSDCYVEISTTPNARGISGSKDEFSSTYTCQSASKITIDLKGTSVECKVGESSMIVYLNNREMVLTKQRGSGGSSGSGGSKSSTKTSTPSKAPAKKGGTK